MTKDKETIPSKLKLIAICDGHAIKDDGDQTKSMQDFYDDIAIDVLARTLWGEARGQGSDGMNAVAAVILNRVRVAQQKGSFWWGNNIIQVCQKPYQFSCWNRSDPNFRKLQAVTEEDLYFATAVRIARRAVLDQIDDQTLGATHYHADTIKPYWAKGKRPSIIIGNHVFYTLVEG